MSRFYVENAVVEFDEDSQHEFKGHRSICVEDLGPWAFFDAQQKHRSKRAASRALNSFLNTGKGGTVYLGVGDDGRVFGHRLTLYQRDHVVTAVKDLLEDRYSPPVKSSQYKVDFVPVLLHEFWENCPQESKTYDAGTRGRSHLLRTHELCWCERDKLARKANGLLCGRYVIEITIFPFSPNGEGPEETSFQRSVPPLYEDEEGRAYLRMQASSYRVSIQDIIDLTERQAQDYFEPEVQKLSKILSNLQSSLG